MREDEARDGSQLGSEGVQTQREGQTSQIEYFMRSEKWDPGGESALLGWYFIPSFLHFFYLIKRGTVLGRQNPTPQRGYFIWNGVCYFERALYLGGGGLPPLFFGGMKSRGMGVADPSSERDLGLHLTPLLL